MPAPNEGLDHDLGSDRGTVGVGTERRDPSGNLVAPDAWIGRVGIPAEIDIKVSGAQSGGADLNQGFPAFGHWPRPIRKNQIEG